MSSAILASLRRSLRTNKTDASIFVDTGHEDMAVIHARGVAYFGNVRLCKIEPSGVSGLMTITFEGRATTGGPFQFPYKIARDAFGILERLASGKTLF